MSFLVSRLHGLYKLLLGLLIVVAMTSSVNAEYGDVVINNFHSFVPRHIVKAGLRRKVLRVSPRLNW